MVGVVEETEAMDKTDVGSESGQLRSEEGDLKGNMADLGIEELRRQLQEAKLKVDVERRQRAEAERNLQETGESMLGSRHRENVAHASRPCNPMTTGNLTILFCREAPPRAACRGREAPT